MEECNQGPHDGRADVAAPPHHICSDRTRSALGPPLWDPNLPEFPMGVLIGEGLETYSLSCFKLESDYGLACSPEVLDIGSGPCAPECARQ